MNRTKLFALAAMVALVVHPMSAQQDSAKPKMQQAGGDIVRMGKKLPRLGVYDTLTNEVIKGAEVSDAYTNLIKKTQEGGFVTLDFLTPVLNFYFIEVRVPGYAPRQIKVRADTLKDIMVFLTPAPLGSGSQNLDTIKVTAVANNATLGFHGFESRRVDPMLHGAFVSSEELRTKQSGRSIESLLKPYGLESASQRQTSLTLPCILKVWVDGMAMKPGSVDLRNETTDNYEAVEFYQSASFAPQEFVSPNACGIVVLWRRRS